MTSARALEATKRADLYRAAAKLLEDGKCRDTIPGACSAISDALYPKLERIEAYGMPESKKAMEPFVQLFKPETPMLSSVYWGNDWGDTDSERTDCRALALCFMAAMVEAGDA